jgi:predicted glycosyltransferase
MEQLEVEKLLLKLLHNDPELFVFVRLHPSEKHSIPFNHERMILLPDFKEQATAALFDLLAKSHLAISFGSTVSLQATWMGIPSVTFEFAEKSLLLFVDQQKVMHFNATEKLENYILQTLNQPKKNSVQQNSDMTVAQKMAALILAEK